MTQTDITRPTVLLTGPTSGIGAGMLRALLRHPARPHLVLLARNAEAMDAALTAARSAGLRARGVHVDLADLSSVQRALTEVSALVASGEIAPLDAALLNAGTQFMSRAKRGAQGHELTFTVNVIAQHQLVTGLTPLLAPGGHIVVMGSSTHRGKKQSFNLIPDPQWQAPTDLATPDPVEAPTAAAGRERGGIAYASSKLALVTASHVWAERVATAGGRLNTYDPGLTVGTGLVREMSAFRYWVWRRIMPVMALHPKATTARITGQHAVQLALGDTHAGVHDGYMEIGKLTEAERVTFDVERQRDLIAWLDEAIAPFAASDARVHSQEA
jgi:NAD(P)-dependent dehydrogenase (short-subunit alcohol dehydrogenase family)